MYHGLEITHGRETEGFISITSSLGSSDLLLGETLQVLLNSIHKRGLGSQDLRKGGVIYYALCNIMIIQALRTLAEWYFAFIVKMDNELIAIVAIECDTVFLLQFVRETIFAIPSSYR